MTARPPIVDVGVALFGTHWQADMARALNVSKRSVRYWAQGRDVPTNVWSELRQIAFTIKADADIAIGIIYLQRKNEGEST